VPADGNNVMFVGYLCVSRLSSFTTFGCHPELLQERIDDDMLRSGEVIAERALKGLVGMYPFVLVLPM